MRVITGPCGRLRHELPAGWRSETLAEGSSASVMANPSCGLASVPRRCRRPGELVPLSTVTKRRDEGAEQLEILVGPGTGRESEDATIGQFGRERRLFGSVR